MHEGTTDFLKMLTTFIFIGVSVWWLNGAIGSDYTVLVIFALIGVILFAGGALFAHINQKSTLNAITKFNANDAQIDKYRMQTMKQLTSGQAAWEKAQANVWQTNHKDVLKLADQRAKLLTVANQESNEDETFWTYEDQNAEFEEWK